MNYLTTAQTIRISKAALMLFVSIFGLMVMYSNFTDYPSNYQYLSHVLSMDTVEGANYQYRAITSPMAHHRIYWLIITLEVLSTCFCVAGTYYLYININSSAKKFHEAKRFSMIGLLIAIFIYYVGFQVIGVEWFNMDESDRWNYKNWAQNSVDFMLPLMIFMALRIEG